MANEQVYWKDLAAYREHVTAALKSINQKLHACSWKEARWTWNEHFHVTQAAREIIKQRERRKKPEPTQWPTQSDECTPTSDSSSTAISQEQRATQAGEDTS